MRVKNIFYNLVICLLLAGCADSAVPLYAPVKFYRMQSPETGRHTGSFSVAARSDDGERVSIVDDARATHPQSAFSTIDSSDSGGGGSAAITLFPGVELIGEDTPFKYLGAKVQVYGPRRDTNRLKELMLTVVAAYGRDEFTGAGSDDGYSDASGSLFSPNTRTHYDWSVAHDSRLRDFALIFGYRAQPSILYYGGGFIQRYDFDTRLTRLRTDFTTDPVTNEEETASINEAYRFNRALTYFGYNAALEFSIPIKRVDLTVTGELMMIFGGKNSDDNDSALSTALGLRF